MQFAASFALLMTIAIAACSTQPREPNAPAAPQSSSAAKAPVKCEDLKSLAVPNTTIGSADSVTAGAFKPPVPDLPFLPPTDYSKLPPFCRVVGSIAPTPDSDIRFELWLPTENWNGKFMQTGNGGAAGAIIYFS